MIRQVMWKLFSRRFRETFDRGANFRKNDVRITTESTFKRQCCWNFSPLAVNQCERKHLEKSTCQKEKEEPQNKERIATSCFFENLVGAFSCSSVLVLGWVLTQPYAHWRKWLKRDEIWFQQCSRQAIPSPIVPLVARVAISQPVNTIGIKSSSPVNVSNESTEESITYGPKTAEETLEEAAEELISVHNSVMAEIENRRGVDLINDGQNRKAVNLFRSATAKGYAPAAYNLGQCHELGLGTQQDFAQAAKWYKKAADLGHATAMYNLGVFYAHGWGGLEANKEIAKDLFSQAAVKGQPDARTALGMDLIQTPPPSLAEEDSDWTFTKTHREEDRDDNQNPDKLYSIGLSHENSFDSDASDPSLILQMYQLASDLGHSEARSRLEVLKAYDAIGLLSEFLTSKKSIWKSSVIPSMEGFRSAP